MNTELQQISDGVSPEARALAHHLRDLFRPLQVSVRRYATRCHRDPGTVSRYLNGTRIPPWSFVRGLLTEVGEARQLPLLGEVVDHTRELHRAALRVSNISRYEVQNLQDQLEQADRSHRQAEIREQALLEALQARQHRVAELEVSLRELEAAGGDRQSEMQRLESSEESARAEILRLREEIKNLREELTRAKEIAQSTEERCNALEVQLESAEITAESGNDYRDAEALHTALQEAAEANSRAETLQREINRLTRRSRKSEPKTPRREEIRLPPQELTELLLNSAALKTDMETHSLARVIGLHYPRTGVAEVIRELKDRHEQDLSSKICVNFAERTPDEVFDLITDLGWDFRTVDDWNLPDSTLVWFTWHTDFHGILEMISRLSGIPSGEPIHTVLRAAAQRKEHLELIELINALEAAYQDIIIEQIAAVRDADRIPGLLVELRKAGEDHFADTLIRMIAIDRRQSVETLLTFFRAMGPAGSKDLILLQESQQETFVI